ncbi:MAG TPA: TIGR02996 domain-containing protein [Gemmataceae bacterium]
MTDREALLAAIRAVPDDDLPRLVYADWLEENAGSLPAEERDCAGDRAAFIRSQVEAAQAEPFSPSARLAADRAARLLTPANRTAWSLSLHGLVSECSFERGFIEHAAVDAAQFLDAAEAIFEAEPIRSLRVNRPRPSEWEFEVPLEPIFEQSRLRQITALDLREIELSHDDCEKLVESPHTGGLVHLGLAGNPIFPPWFRRVIESDAWPNLSSLDLAEISNLGPAIAAAFKSANHRRFAKLDLSGIGFRSDDLKKTLASPCVAGIEELRLRWQSGGFSPGSLTHLDLGWVIPWDNLRLLDLDGQGLGAEGVRAIAQEPRAANLRWLGLARNALIGDAVTILTEESSLNLYYLDVRQSRLGFNDAVALRRRYPEAKIML